jgi:protein-disulfide isomerase
MENQKNLQKFDYVEIVDNENVVEETKAPQEQNNNLFIPVSILLAGFLIAGGIYLSNKGNAPLVDTNIVKNSDVSGIQVKPVSKEDHILGNPDAPIVMIEFSDTECPYCKMFQTTMQSIIDSYGKDGKVAWVYRHFPLDSLHSKSRKEAEATECVNELGGNTAFWKMLDTIYTETPANNGLDAAKLPEFAGMTGVDVTKFNACLDSGKYAATVEADFQDGVKAGAQGTPYTVLVLKNTLSADAEKTMQDFILKNNLGQNVWISSTKKEVVMSGALPADMIKTILDTMLK